jgi:hypothetical protein
MLLLLLSSLLLLRMLADVVLLSWHATQCRTALASLERLPPLTLSPSLMW